MFLDKQCFVYVSCLSLQNYPFTTGNTSLIRSTISNKWLRDLVLDIIKFENKSHITYQTLKNMFGRNRLFRMSVYHVSNIGTIDAFLSTV